MAILAVWTMLLKQKGRKGFMLYLHKAINDTVQLINGGLFNGNMKAY